MSATEVLRCHRCMLVQFQGHQTRCRRCHEEFTYRPVSKRHLEPVGLVSEPVVAIVNLATLTFGKRFKRVRMRAGMTQAQVAARMGAQRTYISKIEVGRNEPTLPLVLRLAGGLGCDVSALFPTHKAKQPADTTGPFMQELATYAGQLSHAQWLAVLLEAKNMSESAKLGNTHSVASEAS